MKIKNPNGRSVKDGGDRIKSADVLVLGAGLAGLGAATKLKSSGMTFLVLEAACKAGGRVNTMPMLSFNELNFQNRENQDERTSDHKRSNIIPVIDSGAQWLHGKYNYLHDLAERLNLLIGEQSKEGLGTYIRDDGFQLNDYFVKQIDFKVGQILEDCESYARNNINSYPESVNSFLKERFTIFLQNIENSEERKIAEQLLDWHIRFQVIDNSCLTLDHVSAKSWGKYSYNGENCQAHYNFRNGFSSVIDALVNELGECNILFKKEVIGIDCNVAEPKISVKCSDTTIYQANHIIVTFSLGCLKQLLNKNVFRPELPIRTRQTIQDIGFETINKLFFQFDEPWWSDVDGIQLIFQDQNYEVNFLLGMLRLVLQFTYFILF